MDNRQSWEIAYCIRVCYARSFIRYLTVEGHERATLEMAYRTDNLHRWAKDRIAEILARAEQVRGGRQLSAAAQNVVAEAVEELRITDCAVKPRHFNGSGCKARFFSHALDNI